MTRIKTYAIDSAISENDIVIGSDYENSGITKNYTFKDIITFLDGKVGGGVVVDGVSIDLSSKANVYGQVFTGEIYAPNLSGINNGDQILPTTLSLGLENVDNTSDLNKPISIATQDVLDTKADVSGQVFTGEIYAPNLIGENTGDQEIPTILSLGLDNVDNTSDINKPVSIANQTALNGKEDKSNKNISNGYAGLGSDGKIISSQLPALVVSDTYFAVSDSAMTALTNATTGDICIRTDLSKTYILRGTNYSVLSDWTELLSPTGGTTSVFGRTGTVIANSNDYDASQILETSTRVFQTSTQRTNNDATSSIQTQLNNKVDKVTGSRLITSNEATTIANTSGTNSGNNAVNTLYSGLVSNATHTGEVTGSLALTITNKAVTLSKMNDVATGTVFYRKTAGAGPPEVQTLATLKTDLGITLSAPISGSANYIQVSPVTVQTASIYISGSGTFASGLFINGGGVTSTITNASSIFTLGTTSAHNLTLRTNNVVRLTINSAGEATFSSSVNSTRNIVNSVSNSTWASTITNTGTTDAHGLYVNLGSSSTGIPFRVDKGGVSLFNVANSGAATFSNTISALGGNSTNWNSAYSWGNHATSGYLKTIPAQTFASLTDKPTTLSGYGITNAYPLTGNPSGFLTTAAPVSGSANYIQNQTASTQTAGMKISGTITASGFFQVSDLRLKDIISQDGDVINFTWKDKRDELVHIGYIAQEVKKENPDQVQEDGDGMLSVNYIEVLVQKIKDLENRIKQLEK